MKIKKLIILLIAILAPLTITTLIGLYAYGTIGDWTGNQEKYIDELFYKDQTNEKSISNYLKFNSEKYKNHTNQVKLYKDYKSSTLETVEPTNGEFSVGGLNFSLYTMLSQTEGATSFHYNFFFHSIDNNIVNPNNLVVIFIEENDQNSVDNLKLALEQFEKEFIEENEPSVFSAGTSRLNANVLFTTGTPLNDVTGKGVQKADGTISTPYLYSSDFLQYQYAITDEAGDELSSGKKFTDLSSCSFALLEVKYDKNNEADTVNILTTGQINGIEGTAEEYIKANPDMLQGYGLDGDKALTAAGYFNFIWPTVLWQTSIAAVITGIFGYLFYKTWTFEDPNKKKNVR